ncbi:MAG: methyltransferase domain-containing protein [Ignavibacteria bacterium]|nr:methyltransferase domain-containing protein [Ignavibacteria bacterium]
MSQSPSAWYKMWFNSPWYTKLYQHRTEEEAREVVRLVRDIAHIDKGARILDLCCGYGRHANVLAEHGYHVIGLDVSQYLIDLANQRYPHEHVEYVQGDMRGPYPNGPFDAIVNFFTSFGYFDSHEEHQNVLRVIADNLVDSGSFVMDFFNADLVRRTLIPESMNMIGGTTIIQERWIDEPYVRKRITVNVPCSTEDTFEEHVRLYSCSDLTTMITEAGLTVTNIYGSYTGDMYDQDSSQRCIIVARKL